MIVGLKSVSEAVVKNMTLSKTEVGDMVGVLGENSHKLSELNSKLKSVTGANFQIGAATEEQATVISEINQNIHSVTELSTATHLQARTNDEFAQQLHNIAQQLNEIVNGFKVSA